MTPARLARLAVGLALAAAATFWLLRTIDLVALRAMLDPLPWRHLVFAFALLAADFGLRITRWWLLVRAVTPRTSWPACAVALLSSTAANNVLPARIGDVVRVVAFPRVGLGPARLAGTLVIERVLDLWALLAIAALAGHAFLADALPAWVFALAWLAWGALGALILALRRVDPARLALFRPGSGNRLLAKAADALAAAHDAMHRGAARGTLPAAMALSAAAWLLEGAAFAVVLAGVDASLSWGLGWAAMGGATLATMLPAAPGFVGTFHAAAMQPLLWAGADATAAAAFAVLAHAVVWAPLTLVGALIAAFALQRGDVDVRHLRRAARDAPAPPSDPWEWRP